MIAAMLSIATFLGLLAVIGAAVLRRVLGAKVNRRNIALLARRHDLDPATATRLYELARRDGFGSAWGDVVEHPTPAAYTTPTEPTVRTAATPRKTRTRKLADRHQA
jgi:hypothetical protein